MPSDIGLNRRRTTTRNTSSAGSERMNSGAPVSRAAQDAAVRQAARRSSQPVPRVQPLPNAPADPYATGAPYRSPKPVYSDADYKRAMDTDFEYARRAADIATNNAIRRNQAGVAGQKDLIRAGAAAQRGLLSQQNAAAERAQAASIAAAERSQGRQMELGRDQLASNERANARRADAAVSAAGLSAVGGYSQVARQAEAQEKIAKEANELTKYQFDQSLKFQREQVDPFRQGRRSTSTSGGGMISLASQAAGMNDLQLEVLRGKAIRGDAGAIARLQLLQGGSSGGGSSGGNTYTTTTAPAEDPRLAITRENNAAAAARQAAQIAAGDRDRADRLASTERQQSAQLQYQREAPGIAATAEEDLRKAARRAALAVYNSAGRGRQLAIP